MGLAKRFETNRVLPWGSDADPVVDWTEAARRAEMPRRRMQAVSGHNGVAKMARATL